MSFDANDLIQALQSVVDPVTEKDILRLNWVRNLVSIIREFRSTLLWTIPAVTFRGK